MAKDTFIHLHVVDPNNEVLKSQYPKESADGLSDLFMAKIRPIMESTGAHHGYETLNVSFPPDVAPKTIGCVWYVDGSEEPAANLVFNAQLKDLEGVVHDCSIQAMGAATQIGEMVLGLKDQLIGQFAHKIWTEHGEKMNAKNQSPIEAKLLSVRNVNDDPSTMNSLNGKDEVVTELRLVGTDITIVRTFMFTPGTDNKNISQAYAESLYQSLVLHIGRKLNGIDSNFNGLNIREFSCDVYSKQHAEMIMNQANNGAPVQ